MGAVAESVCAVWSRQVLVLVLPVLVLNWAWEMQTARVSSASCRSWTWIELADTERCAEDRPRSFVQGPQGSSSHLQCPRVPLFPHCIPFQGDVSCDVPSSQDAGSWSQVRGSYLRARVYRLTLTFQGRADWDDFLELDMTRWGDVDPSCTTASRGGETGPCTMVLTWGKQQATRILSACVYSQKRRNIFRPRHASPNYSMVLR